MGNLSRVSQVASWGQAERAALDRCLSVPGLSERGRGLPPPVRLSRTIETEIIPRLMLAHRDAPEVQAPEAAEEPSAADVRDFTRTVLEGAPQAACDAVEAIRTRGCSLESIFLQLLAPTARLLGDMWRDDLCSFTDVTIGLSRLQQIARDLGTRFEMEGRPDRRGSILLAAAPGEQHSFGLSMLGSFFRRAGWEVYGSPGTERSELLRIAREEWLDAIGVSVSSDIFYSGACSCIAALKAASRNGSVFVMVGGRYFCDHPERAVEAGADAMAHDAPDALRQAHRCLGFAIASC